MLPGTWRRLARCSSTHCNRECLVERTKPIDDIIRRNNLKVFANLRPKRTSKRKHRLACLRNNAGAVHWLSDQVGNIKELFRHENQTCLPALFHDGSLRLCTKSYLLQCLESLYEVHVDAPVTTCLLIDGIAETDIPGIGQVYYVWTETRRSCIGSWLMLPSEGSTWRANN